MFQELNAAEPLFSSEKGDIPGGCLNPPHLDRMLESSAERLFGTLNDTFRLCVIALIIAGRKVQESYIRLVRWCLDHMTLRLFPNTVHPPMVHHTLVCVHHLSSQ